MFALGNEQIQIRTWQLKETPKQSRNSLKGKEQNQEGEERKGRGSRLWSRHHQSAHVEKESAAVLASRPAKAAHVKRKYSPEKIQMICFQGLFVAKIYRPAVLS